MTTVLFDKTGTLTASKPSVDTVVQLADKVLFSKEMLLAIVGTAESGSEHPIATAIVQCAKEVQSIHSVAVCNGGFMQDTATSLPRGAVVVRESLWYNIHLKLLCTHRSLREPSSDGSTETLRLDCRNI